MLDKTYQYACTIHVRTLYDFARSNFSRYTCLVAHDENMAQNREVPNLNYFAVSLFVESPIWPWTMVYLKWFINRYFAAISLSSFKENTNSWIISVISFISTK